MGENGILSVSTIDRQKLDTNSWEDTKINWYWPHPTTLHKGHRGRGDDDLVLTEKQTTYLFVWLQDVWAWHRDNDVDLVNDVERLILNLVGQEGHVVCHVDQLTQHRFLQSTTNIDNIPHTHIMQSASTYTSILFHENVLAYKCSLPQNTQASYFIQVNVCGGIFASISKCKGNHNLLRLGYCWHCIPYETCIIYKTTITRWKNRLYCVLETTRRCQVQQFQRHQNTFVLSYDITISIFLLLAYCFITIKLYQIHGQHIDRGLWPGSLLWKLS